MNKLSNILQLAELFYKRAMQALAAQPAYVMQDDPEGLEKAKDMVDGDDPIDNVDLATQMTRVIEAYEAFIQSLNGPAPKEGDETPLDLREALKARVDELQVNPYLYQEEDSEDYTETHSPSEIIDAATNLLDDADNKIEAKAADAGLDKADIKAAQEGALIDMGMPQAAKDVINKMDENQQKQFAEKVQKQLDYQKKYNESLKFAKKIGFKGLLEQAQMLQEKIRTTADPEKKKIFEEQLAQVMKKSESIRKNKEGLLRRHEQMKADPARFAKHQKELVSRQATRRKIDDKRFELIERLQRATNPQEQSLIMRELITLEKAVLTKKKQNYDSDEFKNDPDLAKLIDPKEIIKRHLERKERHQSHDVKEVAKRQTQRAEGDVIGLLLILTQQFSNPPNDLKKKIQKKLDTDGFKDPFFEPYVKALSEAEAAMKANPSPATQAALQAAQKSMADAVPVYKNQHPLLLEVNRRLAPGLELKKALQEIANKQKKTGQPLAPWFYASPVPEDKKPLLQDLIQKCQQAATSVGAVSPVLADTFAQIANKLQEKLG